MSMLDTVLIWISRNHKRWQGDLEKWLSIPSVSAQEAHAGDVREAAEWAEDYLRNIGLKVEIIATPRHPVILATTPAELAEPGAPEVLLYGHYDVQPPEPLDLWQSPPFKPTVRDGKLYARGANDDKGQVHAHLAAMLAWREINQKLPVRMTVLLEGEEEIGSPNLMAVVQAHAAQLRACKTLIISDGNQFAKGVPSIIYGLRGLVYAELTVTTANTDLHSGQFGGAVANPANALARIIAQLHDEQNRVTVPGFYTDVRPLTDTERAAWRQLPFDEAKFAGDLGVPAVTGEAGYSTLERLWGRPTLDVNGLTSGYQGPGAKTVLPCRASCKVSMRLVPDQAPAAIMAAFDAHVQSLAPAGTKVEVHWHGPGSPPALTAVTGPAIAAAQRAITTGYGIAPVLCREGGSIPVVTWFQQALGLEAVMIGFGLPDDRIHAPNEKIDLDGYFGGIRTAAALYEELGQALR
ncbi:MAG: dipeptidase [Phycisphaerae bacterium]